MIILLITRLGLGSIDVKRLKCADLDWAGNRLSVVQAKTCQRARLQLLKDVGWEVIDYVRNDRPVSGATRRHRPCWPPDRPGGCAV